MILSWGALSPGCDEVPQNVQLLLRILAILILFTAPAQSSIIVKRQIRTFGEKYGQTFQSASPKPLLWVRVLEAIFDMRLLAIMPVLHCCDAH